MSCIGYVEGKDIRKDFVIRQSNLLNNENNLKRNPIDNKNYQYNMKV